MSAQQQSEHPTPAALVLEDGRIHRGTAFGAVGAAFGEAVFSTGMTGYQETLTDPSYRRQIVVATAPQIGNTGWVGSDSPGRDAIAGDVDTLNDNESGRIWVAGFVIRELSPRPSNWRAAGSLADELERQQVVGIAGVDTRSLTRHLRSAGVMRCGIFSGPALSDDADMLAKVRAIAPMAGADLANEVSTDHSYVVAPNAAADLPGAEPGAGSGANGGLTAGAETSGSDRTLTVAALDLGIKSNTPRMFAARGVRTHVLPADATIDDVLALEDGRGVDGIFLSNGPGDPATADPQVELTRQALQRKIPFFGICFGNQILGRALGLGTFKLTFGHRGINQPVKDHRTGRVLITAQNHGFAVQAPACAAAGEYFDTDFGPARIAFTCLNDDVVEGLECAAAPAFSVQFHPEAAAGPHDAGYLFDDFITLMRAHSAAATAGTDASQPDQQKDTADATS
ncbi:glutamine-hydrolyzing carbamoyl-phosphate synthase small subunit [Nakamurella aerolata]|uniref:Carbamoyl phosphate synthase small chain n=1 Tax=Nakamurella aerolata TaxID=1656892 RepID=A0A849ABJ0_9ACTN|nr:glutamine-hydrolyzing carbamoyl-phosphate synthase small subunit [Nakamurella aerolata]NNG37307.1 glutamine-hydrolyzing carbamoyl-phosphate synthase small subunit [Nakamurella aerolata]